MKAALILCPSWTVESPSYTLALLSANLRKHGHETRCFDLNIGMYRNCGDQEEVETWQMDEKGAVWYEESYVSDFIRKHNDYIEKAINEILDYNPEVIGFTVYSTSRHFSYEFAKRIKEKDSKKVIIFGGPQCFRNCEDVDILKHPYIDAACFGEGDVAFQNMLNVIAKNKGAVDRCAGFGIRDKTGKVIDCRDEALLKDLDVLPYADYSDFDLNKYTKKLLPISTSRGCLGNCKFCNESPHWKRYRFRTAENIYNEIRFQLDKYPEIKEFWFNDSLINGNIKILEKLCDLFIKNKLKIRYGGQALIRPGMDTRLLEKMKQSGCAIISYGLESGSNTILKKMGKMYTAETAEKVIKDTYDSGIEVIFNIIVGFPGEGEKEFGETKAFMQSNLNYAKEISIMPLLLIKGSCIYENADKIGVDPGTKYDQLRWRMLDNSSNYDIRIQRFGLLKEVIGKKAYVTCSEKRTKRLLNICLISREYPAETGWGGIGTYTHHLAHGLAERGHNVHVISQSLNGDKYYKEGKVSIHRVSHNNFFFHSGFFREFSLRLEYSRSVCLKLKEVVKKYKIDIVEAPNLSAESFVFGLSKKIPLVIRLHTHFSEAINFYGVRRNIDSKLSCLIEDAAIRKSDLVTCSTRAHASLVAEEIGIRKDKIKIIPLGIPLPPKNESRPEGCKNPVVLFIGRLEKRKGPHILAKAIPSVLKEMPDTEFIFIGRDTFVSKDCISIRGEDKHSFKSMVLKMIPQMYLKNVRFLGYVEQKDMPYYFNLCDVFVAPSLYESFGLIYIEAMSYGKPVIGCGTGGIPEVIKDNKTGVLVPPDDYVSLANAIVDLLNNQKKRIEIGLAARKDIEASFSRELMIERTEKAYASLLI